MVAYVASTGSSGRTARPSSSRLIVLSHNARFVGRHGYRVARFVDPTVTRYTINAAPRGNGEIGCRIQIGAYSASSSTGLSSLCVASLRWSAALGHWVTVRPALHAPTQPHNPPTGPSPLARAFVNPGGGMGGGRPVLAIGMGTLVSFIPSAPFHVGIPLTDNASQPVTLTDVRAVFPHGSVFRQLGTALAAPKPMFGCGISEPSSFGVLRPKPLQVAPGKNACVQLNFRLLGCPAARHASLQSVRLLEVSYRTRAGTIIHQRVGLGESQLKIHPTYEFTLLRHSWARRVVHPCTQ